MNINLRRVYLYVSSFIGLVLILVGATQLVNLALKTWVFTKADSNYYACPVAVPSPVATSTNESVDRSPKDCANQEDQRSAQRQSQAANSIALIVVGLPVWLYHWSKVKDEKDV